jgi:phage-related protein
MPRPYADVLKDGIHELRIKLSGEQTRIVYLFCYRTCIVLTHSFIKRTARASEAEI